MRFRSRNWISGKNEVVLEMRLGARNEPTEMKYRGRNEVPL